tara:strand:- start:424 stop:762 length:339 start_codon:yes stop_codon:yes gene_type:complete
MTWPIAFLLTQLIEITIGNLDFEELFNEEGSLYIFLVSCFTHPIVWFVMPVFADRFGWSYPLFLFFAESYAYGVEYLWYRYLKAKRPFFLSCIVNTASFLTGLLIYFFMGLV